MRRHTEFGRSTSKGVSTPKIGRDLPPLRTLACLIPYRHALPWVKLLSLIVVGQTVYECTYGYPPIQKLCPSHIANIKIVGTDTDRLDTYGFLLTFHISHGSTLYTVSKILIYWPNIENFILNAPTEAVPLVLCNDSLGSETRMMELGGR